MGGVGDPYRRHACGLVPLGDFCFCLEGVIWDRDFVSGFLLSYVAFSGLGGSGEWGDFPAPAPALGL